MGGGSYGCPRPVPQTTSTERRSRMSSNWMIVITIVQMAVVPALAFVIRMIVGDVKDENEALISMVLRNLLTHKLKINLAGTPS